jgi:4-hydroxybenzoate polyprenyltransferase
MKNSVFNTKALAIASLLMVVAFFVDQWTKYNVPIVVYILVLVYSIMTILMYRHLSKVNRENPKRFINSFMGAIGIKLFTSLIFLVVYLFFSEKEDRIPVTLFLFVIYMLNTVILIRQITKEIRAHEDEKKKNSEQPTQ